MLTMAFLAPIGFAARQVYRDNRLAYDTLPDDQRAVLLGSLGVIVLMIAGADEMLGGGAGRVVWVTLIARCRDRRSSARRARMIASRTPGQTGAINHQIAARMHPRGAADSARLEPDAQRSARHSRDRRA